MKEKKTMSVGAFVKDYEIPLSLPTFRGWIKENKRYLIEKKMIMMYRKGTRDYIKILDGNRLYSYFMRGE